MLCVLFGTLNSWATDFYLINKQTPLSVYVADHQKAVVKTVTDLFFDDVETVSGIKPIISNSIANGKLMVGTIGADEEFDQWLAQQKINVNELTGQWEAFKIQVIQTETEPILVILGSDDRGTAYGILELSKIIGVSPWCWWADATPNKISTFILPTGYVNEQQPSVQYRGIFINDEDWGIVPWSNQKFDPQTSSSLSLKTYEKVFELLLRLRANTLWPAMHSCSTPFYFIEGTKELADKYGIVMGTSHCEPLMRNTNGEWKHAGKGEYNYAINKENINDFWADRLQNVSQYENIYTIGMRGVHDGKMEGAETIDEQRKLLTEVIDNQRNLLSQHLKKDVTHTPQVFMPYKEVLDIYKSGLKVPDDVTLVWCDDNYGYITKLSDSLEQQRKGGSGIYYHISYFGKPHDYLWLYSTQPGLIYSEMKKAWDHGARKLWILNVGDIKPAEYGAEFFLDLAWNINSVNNNTVYQHLNNWLSREFGNPVADSLSSVMTEYYHLAGIRKPEFMGWSRTQEFTKTKRRGGFTDVVDTEFNPFMFGDELQKRVDTYLSLEKRVTEVSTQITDYKKDAYFQLIEYPVCAASAMNSKWLNAQKARLYAGYNLPVANEYATLSQNAYDKIKILTDKYNKIVSNGKWDGVMNMQPRALPVFEAPILPEKVALKDNKPATVWLEGCNKPLKNDTIVKLSPFVSSDQLGISISLFSKNGKKINWSCKNKPSWLDIKERNTNLLGEEKLTLGISGKQSIRNKSAKITLVVDKQNYNFEIQTKKTPANIKTESKKMIVWNAAAYEKAENVTVIQGLGHSMNAVLLPAGKEISYKVYSLSSGNVLLKTLLIPTHAPTGGSLQYEVSIDDEVPQIVTFDAQSGTEKWKENVLRGQSLNNTTHKLTQKGEHIVRIKALDNPIIIDQLMLDFDNNREFYQLPVDNFE